MLKKVSSLFILSSLLILMSFGVVQAQKSTDVPTDSTTSDISLSQTFVAPTGGLVFRYPANWTVSEGTNSTTVGDGNVSIEFFNQTLSNSVLQLAGTDLQAGLGIFLGILELNPQQLTQIQLDNRTIIGAFEAKEGIGNYVLLIRSPLLPAEPKLIFARVTGRALDLLSSTDLFLSIIQSFGDLVDVEVDASSSRPTDSPPNISAQATATSAPCFVSVSSTGTASLHVGPGNNRSQIRFLDPNIQYNVLGTADANDGTQWWRLDKNQAAPSQASQVNETWVAESEVDETGDCAAVGTVSAPPIIPIRPTDAPQPTGVPTPNDANALFISFTADRTSIQTGDCVTLSWDVRNINSVFFKGRGVAGQGSSRECISQTTRFELRVRLNSGADEFRFIDVIVEQCRNSLPEFINDILPTGTRQTFDFQLVICDPSQTLVITMAKTNLPNSLDPFLQLFINGSLVAEDDDSAGNLDAQIRFSLSSFPLGPLTIRITATSFEQASSGSYVLLVESIP